MPPNVHRTNTPMWRFANREGRPRPPRTTALKRHRNFLWWTVHFALLIRLETPVGTITHAVLPQIATSCIWSEPLARGMAESARTQWRGVSMPVPLPVHRHFCMITGWLCCLEFLDRCMSLFLRRLAEGRWLTPITLVRHDGFSFPEWPAFVLVPLPP
jgi:hypothetical protein